VTMATLPAGALPFGSTLLSLQRPLLSQGGMLVQARRVINPDDPAYVFTQLRGRQILRTSALRSSEKFGSRGYGGVLSPRLGQ
jgi:hypothetical protein